MLTWCACVGKSIHHNNAIMALVATLVGHPPPYSGTTLCSHTIGTALSVLIKKGVLVSGVVLYASLRTYVQCNWDHAWRPD